MSAAPVGMSLLTELALRGQNCRQSTYKSGFAGPAASGIETAYCHGGHSMQDYRSRSHDDVGAGPRSKAGNRSHRAADADYL
jgi:hypothetical protein